MIYFIKLRVEETTGGVTSGSFKDNINSSIDFNKHWHNSYHFTSGRKVRRTWSNRRSIRYLLEQAQRSFHGRNACEGYKSFRCIVPADFNCVEYRKFLKCEAVVLSAAFYHGMGNPHIIKVYTRLCVWNTTKSLFGKAVFLRLQVVEVREAHFCSV